MNRRHTDFQSVAESTQRQENKALTNTGNNRLQTSLQTNPENGQKTANIDTPELPPELAEIVKVWPNLPEHIKQAIKALVDTHSMKE